VIKSNQRKERIFLKPLVMVHQKMPLVSHVRQTTLLEIIPNTTQAIWEEPGKHLGKQLWVSIDGFRLLTVTNSKDLPIGSKVFEGNSLQDLDTLCGVLFPCKPMNHKGAFPSLCTLFSLIVMNSSCFRILVGKGLVVINNHIWHVLWILFKVLLRDLQVIVVCMVELQPFKSSSHFVLPNQKGSTLKVCLGWLARASVDEC